MGRVRSTVMVVLAVAGAIAAARRCLHAPRRTAMAKEPHFESVIGTRVEDDGPLTPVLEIDTRNGHYIGCDLNYSNADDLEVEQVWLFKPPKIMPFASVIHQSFARLRGSGTWRVWVDQVSDLETQGNAIGSYECIWTFKHHGISSRLYVRAAK
jgi:hypothetical protein